MTSRARGALLERVRALCLSFPETSERESHGWPTFFVREKRSFLNLVGSYYYGEGRPVITCAAPEGAQAALIEAKPELYFLPKYVAKQGWIGMWLDRGAAWAEIAAVVEAAYATAAETALPKKRAARPARPRTKAPARATRTRR